MKKFLLTVLTFIVLSTSTFAQDSAFEKQETVSVEDGSFTVTFLPLGAQYEAKIGQYQTIIAKGYLSGSFSYVSDTYYGTSSHLSVFPSLTAGARHYYNLDKRAEEGKFIAGNSGNYLSGLATITLPPVYMSEGLEYSGGVMYSVGGLWGMQRSYASGFYLNLGIGLGMSGYLDENVFGLIGEFGLGIHFNN